MANGQLNGRLMAEWAWRIITVLLLPAIFYLATTLQRLDTTLRALDRRVIAIEASRFSSSDAARMWREIDGRMDRIERRVDMDGNTN